MPCMPGVARAHETGPMAEPGALPRGSSNTPQAEGEARAGGEDAREPLDRRERPAPPGGAVNDGEVQAEGTHGTLHAPPNLAN